MNIQDLPENSDSSDEDYIPGEKEDVSEVESDGDPEEPLSDSENSKNKGKKRRTAKMKYKKKTKIPEIGNSKENEQQLPNEKSEDDKKKKDDDLWADFMKDTGFTSKNSKSTPMKNNSNSSSTTTRSSSSTKNPRNNSETTPQKYPDKVKITQIFEFAGEEVKIEKEVLAHSAEARLLSEQPKTGNASKGKRASGGLSGISNVLSQLAKKPKISTLEKTKLDWDKFKKEENLEEELETHNKGKDGYLERQDFLERADLRRFEIEKEIRAVERSKRFNSTL